MLARERADVSISDLYIFLDKLRSGESPELKAKHFSFHKILPTDQSRMGFRNPKVCRAFNGTLKKLKESGGYESVYAKYLKMLGLGG